MRSDLMKKGLERAPHRTLFKAMGYTDEEIAQPLIGVVNSANEIIPGHIHLQTITQAVKDGVRMAGGTPMEFPSIGVCDGIAMGHTGMKYSLVSRELIADSVEIMGMAYQFDGFVFIPNCDKIIPGMLMAAARLNVPSIFISGGPMLKGRYKGKTYDLTSGGFEAVAQYASGKIDADRTERAALILTTNLPFSEWTQVFANARLCKAVVDRVTDRAHIIETGWESYRFRRTAESRQKIKKPEGGKGK